MDAEWRVTEDASKIGQLSPRLNWGYAMAIITVSRQLGSGGDLIARKVAEKLGYEYVDHRLVKEIAEITDTTHEEVEQFDEKAEGRIQFFLKRLLVPEIGPGGFPLSSAAYFPEFGLEFPYVTERDASEETSYIDRGTYQLLITTMVQEFGDTGSTVIVGRASQIILADHSQALHVRIIAPFETRCERIMEAREVDFESAKDLVQQHDRWRKLYLRNYHNSDWDDPLLYHLTINSGKLKIEDAVDLIAHSAN